MKRIFIFYYANPDDLAGNVNKYTRLKREAMRAEQDKKCEIKVVAAQLALSVDIDEGDIVMFVTDDAKSAEGFLKACITEIVKKIPASLIGVFADDAIDINDDDCLQITSCDPISICTTAIINLNLNAQVAS